jgi:hypothetical protein
VLPQAQPAGPGRVPAAPAAGPLPWPVWLGVGLVALGLPLGGGLVAARRRGRAPRASRRDAPSSHPAR